jgi:hypothetical protein
MQEPISYEEVWGPKLVSAPPPPRRVGPAAVPPPFLTIPLEIRNRIYRHLLRTDEPICHASQRSLWTQILATCRQVYEEGKVVLYGENVWEIRIGVVGLTWEQYRNNRDCVRLNAEPLFRYLRKFSILVTVDGVEDLPLIQLFTVKVCNFLSTLKNLELVSIRLQVTKSRLKTENLCYILERFSQVRPVQTVIIRGVSPFFKNYLTHCMNGLPLKGLQSMFHIVCLCANVCKNDTNDAKMVKAYRALKTKNSKRLESLMAGIVPRALDPCAEAFRHLTNGVGGDGDGGGVDNDDQDNDGIDIEEDGDEDGQDNDGVEGEDEGEDDGGGDNGDDDQDNDGINNDGIEGDGDGDGQRQR